MIDIKSAGVYGDGIHSDDIPVQKILDSGERILFFPNGRYLISSTLKIPSNTKIIADKNAEFIWDGEIPKKRGDFLLTNSEPKTGNSNIEINGGIWNGNNGGKCNVKPDMFDENGVCGAVMNFFNVDGLVLKNMKIINPVTYYARFSLVNHFSIEYISLESENKLLNQDGLHFCGEVRNGKIKNISSETCGQPNDDFIAFNADDCIIRAENFDMLRGAIENIEVENISAVSCHAFIRLLSVTAPIRNITICNVQGGCNVFAVNMDAARDCRTPLFDDSDYPEGVGIIENVLIDGMNVYYANDFCRKNPMVYCETNVDNFEIRDFKRDYSKDMMPELPSFYMAKMRKTKVVSDGVEHEIESNGEMTAKDFHNLKITKA